MKEEEFADGLTEEIIDKLSKVPGIRVSAATASFYFRYKKTSVAEIARTLGVVYVLDGSTRQSGNSVRTAARLVRAENSYVIRSETYDRPFVGRRCAGRNRQRSDKNAAHIDRSCSQRRSISEMDVLHSRRSGGLGRTSRRR